MSKYCVRSDDSQCGNNRRNVALVGRCAKDCDEWHQKYCREWRQDDEVLAWSARLLNPGIRPCSHLFFRNELLESFMHAVEVDTAMEKRISERNKVVLIRMVSPSRNKVHTECKEKNECVRL